MHFFRRAENDFSGRRLRCGDDQRIFAVDRDPDQVSGYRHRNAGVDTLRQYGVMKKLTVAGDHAQGSEIFQLQHEISADGGDHGTFGVFAVGVEFKCQFSCRHKFAGFENFPVLETVRFIALVCRTHIMTPQSVISRSFKYTTTEVICQRPHHMEVIGPKIIYFLGEEPYFFRNSVARYCGEEKFSIWATSLTE